MKKLTAYDFNRMTPERLADFSDEVVYAAAVAAKKINSGMFKVVK
jgi:hypothetical protein